MQEHSQLEGFLKEFRKIVPANSATARAIDRQEPWEKVAVTAVEDGYIDFAEDFNCLVEACLRRNS